MNLGAREWLSGYITNSLVMEANGVFGAAAISVGLTRLYWGFLDRRLTDIHNHTELLQSIFTDESIEDTLFEGRIESVQCHTPLSRLKTFLRFVGFDYGRTQATIILPNTPFTDEQLDELQGELGDVGVTLIDCGHDYPTGGSKLIIEI